VIDTPKVMGVFDNRALDSDATRQFIRAVQSACSQLPRVGDIYVHAKYG
jgi:hypothetical protein